jgi:hypothetical protein
MLEGMEEVLDKAKGKGKVGRVVGGQDCPSCFQWSCQVSWTAVSVKARWASGRITGEHGCVMVPPSRHKLWMTSRLKLAL